MLNSIYWELNNKYLTTFALLKGDKIEWFYLLVQQVRSILKIQGKNVFSIIMLRQQSKKYVISETSRRKQVIQVFHLFFYLSLYFYFFFFCKTIRRKGVFQFFHSLCLVELIHYSLCPQTLTNYYKLEKIFSFLNSVKHFKSNITVLQATSVINFKQQN